MAVFTIFEHPGKNPDKTIFVKEGFSAGAFVFTVLWALWHRLWVVAAILVALYSALMLAPTYLGVNENITAILNFGLGIFLGFEAEELRSAALRRSGYAEAGFVMATSQEEAELRHAFARPKTVVSASSPPLRPMTAAADTLGLFGNV